MIKNNEEWRSYIEEGNQYLRTAVKGLKRKEVFTPTILYNILSMSIEKFFMGYLLFYHKLPESHRLINLLQAIEETNEIDNILRKRILWMDSFQDICSFDPQKKSEFKEKDIMDFIDITAGVKFFVSEQLKP